MEPPEFTISLLQIVAWPLVSLTLAYWFKTEICGLLKRISTLKHKDTELHFEREALVHAADKIQKDSATEHASFSTPEAQKTFAILEIDPNYAVIAAWVEFELAAREKLSAIAPVTSSRINDRPVPIGRIIDELFRREVIDKSDYDFLRLLRDLRNGVLHHPEFEVDEVTARKAATALLTLAWELKNK